MDPSVHHAMARWPDVPAVFGYVGLDRRGTLYLEGAPVTHERTAAFMRRNFGLDDHGRAFFQNGPQRAYADLEVTPWVARLTSSDALVTHTEQAIHHLREAWLTSSGDLVLVTEFGPALVHAQDLDRMADHMSGEIANPAAGHAPLTLALLGEQLLIHSLADDDLAGALGFQRQPEPAPGEPGAVAAHRPAWRRRPGA